MFELTLTVKITGRQVAKVLQYTAAWILMKLFT